MKYPGYQNNTKISKKRLVVFDLDGTLINGQSQKMLITFAYKNNYINFLNFSIINIWFFIYKINLVNNPQKILQYALKNIIKNKKKKEVTEIISEFYENILKYKFNKKRVLPSKYLKFLNYFF